MNRLSNRDTDVSLKRAYMAMTVNLNGRVSWRRMYASRTPFRPRCLVKRRNSPESGLSHGLSPPTSPVAVRRRLKFKWMRLARELTTSFTLSFASEISVVADTFLKVTVVVSRKFFRKWKFRAKWAQFARSILHRTFINSVSYAFHNFERMRLREQWLSLVSSLRAIDGHNRTTSARTEFIASRHDSLSKKWRYFARRIKTLALTQARTADSSAITNKRVLQKSFMIWKIRSASFIKISVPDMILRTNIGIDFELNELITLPDVQWISVLDDVKRCKEDAINEFCWFVVDEMGVKIPEVAFPVIAVNGFVGDVKETERRDIEVAAAEMRRLWLRMPEIRFPFFGVGADKARDRAKAEKRGRIFDADSVGGATNPELVMEKPTIPRVYLGSSGRVFQRFARNFADEKADDELELELEVRVDMNPLSRLHPRIPMHVDSILWDAGELGRYYRTELSDLLNVCFRGIEFNYIPTIRIDLMERDAIFKSRDVQISVDLIEIEKFVLSNEKLVLNALVLFNREAIPEGKCDWEMAFSVFLGCSDLVDKLRMHYSHEPIPTHSEVDYQFFASCDIVPVNWTGLEFRREEIPNNTENDAELAGKCRHILSLRQYLPDPIHIDYNREIIPNNTENDAALVGDCRHFLSLRQYQPEQIRIEYNREEIPNHIENDISMACDHWNLEFEAFSSLVPIRAFPCIDADAKDTVRKQKQMKRLSDSNLCDWKAIWDIPVVDFEKLRHWHKPQSHASGEQKAGFTIEEWQPKSMVYATLQRLAVLKWFRSDQAGIESDIGTGRILTQSGALPELLRSISGISKLENFDYFRESILKLANTFTGRMFLKTRYPPYVLTLVSRQMKIINRFTLHDKIQDPTRSRLFTPALNVKKLSDTAQISRLREFQCLSKIQMFDPDLFLAQNKYVTHIVPKTRFYAHIFAYVELNCATMSNMTRRERKDAVKVRVASRKRLRKRKVVLKKRIINVKKKILTKKIINVPKIVTVIKRKRTKKHVSRAQDGTSLYFAEQLDEVLRGTIGSLVVRRVESVTAMKVEEKQKKRVIRKQKVYRTPKPTENDSSITPVVKKQMENDNSITPVVQKQTKVKTSRRKRTKASAARSRDAGHSKI